MLRRHDLKQMILHFRVSELQQLLSYFGINRYGRKEILLERAMELLKDANAAVSDRIQSLNKRRFKDAKPPKAMKTPWNRSSSSRHERSRSSETTVPPSEQPLLLYSGPPGNKNKGGFPVNPDVKFKELPFFDVLGVLLRPSTLKPTQENTSEEKIFQFHLTPSQVMEMHNILGKIVQIQVRICLLNTSSEQLDFFPKKLTLHVNGQPVDLPFVASNKTAAATAKLISRPLNITTKCHLSPFIANAVRCEWITESNSPGHVITVHLVKHLDHTILLERLKSRKERNPHYTTAMVKEKLEKQNDQEICITKLKASLNCPIGKNKMVLPCRPKTCEHLQCFDAVTYLKMNEKNPRWLCPVCDKQGEFENIQVDGLFLEILNETPDDCTEIQFDENANWSLATDEDDQEAVFITDGNNSKSDSPPKIDVIDLTLSDDEEEDNVCSSNTKEIDSEEEQEDGDEDDDDDDDLGIVYDPPLQASTCTKYSAPSLFSDINPIKNQAQVPEQSFTNSPSSNKYCAKITSSYVNPVASMPYPYVKKSAKPLYGGQHIAPSSSYVNHEMTSSYVSSNSYERNNSIGFQPCVPNNYQYRWNCSRPRPTATITSYASNKTTMQDRYNVPIPFFEDHSNGRNPNFGQNPIASDQKEISAQNGYTVSIPFLEQHNREYGNPNPKHEGFPRVRYSRDDVPFFEQGRDDTLNRNSNGSNQNGYSSYSAMPCLLPIQNYRSAETCPDQGLITAGMNNPVFENDEKCSSDESIAIGQRSPVLNSSLFIGSDDSQDSDVVFLE